MHTPISFMPGSKLSAKTGRRISCKVSFNPVDMRKAGEEVERKSPQPAPVRLPCSSAMGRHNVSCRRMAPEASDKVMRMGKWV